MRSNSKTEHSYPNTYLEMLTNVNIEMSRWTAPPSLF